MVYPSDFEIKLGFDQIRQRLGNYCLSTLGRIEVDKIRFRTEYKVIKELLDQGSEFKSIRERAIPFPLSQYHDPSALYPIIAIEDSFIEAESLREIALSIQVIEDCVSFLKKEQGAYPNLYQLSLPVNLSTTVKESINSRIDDMGKLKDNASPDLNRIRKKLRDEAGRARRLVDQMFREAVGNGMVPEGSSPVIRDGRVVIPVLSEYKRKIKGVIMDESSTGQTVYMEPTEVIEANNEIRNLELEERRESIKILRELTSLLREHLPAIELGFDFLGKLDFIQAKIRFAIDIEGDIPHLVSRPVLNWINARHPLLFLSHKGKSPVVPLNIDLKQDERFLLVSGPNAGGKSVCLKTVGLLQYMIQCGLLVPLDVKSDVGVFHHIFLDIGDQQSIENDLSTYSSHLRNMRHFVDRANENTLVLMDELGAGTDPNFGGGIAEAILKNLVENGVWGVATTHYYNLKLYADHNKGIRNAAMQFDSKNLEPRFILDIGKPGSSFALEIARKTGLGRIIKEAEDIIGKDLTGLETLIKKVSDEKQELIKREREVRDKEIKYKELLNKYDQLNQELESRKKEIINKAKEEAAVLIQQTNREIEKTIRHIKENRAEKKETRKVRQSLEGLKENVRPSVERIVTSVNEKIEEGDYVRMVGQDVTGQVVSLKGKSAVVEFGDMRSSIKLEKLVKSSARQDKAAKSRRSFGVDLLAKQTNFNTTLDVRGMRAEEIIPILDQFLDDAVLLGHGGLRILHGKGEGVLRSVVRDRLKLNKNVVSFGHEHIERGGDGITTIVLK
jgi:DNA mismatch repair protein MutS2